MRYIVDVGTGCCESDAVYIELEPGEVAVLEKVRAKIAETGANPGLVAYSPEDYDRPLDGGGADWDIGYAKERADSAERRQAQEAERRRLAEAEEARRAALSPGERAEETRQSFFDRVAGLGTGVTPGQVQAAFEGMAKRRREQGS
jgi:hypothetical protein